MLRCLVLLNILITIIPWESTAITNRKPLSQQSDNVRYFRHIPNGPPSGPLADCESGLKEAIHQALLREGYWEPNLRLRLNSAQLIGRQDNVTPFGDVIVLARGQLYAIHGGNFLLLQDPYQNDCDDCHNPRRCERHDCQPYSPQNQEILVALWTVKRLRHRDADRTRFELEYIISPINAVNDQIVMRRGRFNYAIPGHVFVIRSSETNKNYAEYYNRKIVQTHFKPEVILGVDAEGHKHILYSYPSYITPPPQLYTNEISTTNQGLSTTQESNKLTEEALLYKRLIEALAAKTSTVSYNEGPHRFSLNRFGEINKTATDLNNPVKPIVHYFMPVGEELMTEIPSLYATTETYVPTTLVTSPTSTTKSTQNVVQTTISFGTTTSTLKSRTKTYFTTKPVTATTINTKYTTQSIGNTQYTSTVSQNPTDKIATPQTTKYTTTSQQTTKYTTPIPQTTKYTSTTSQTTKYTSTTPQTTKYTSTTSQRTKVTPTTPLITKSTSTTSQKKKYSPTTSQTTKYTPSTPQTTKYTSTTGQTTAFTAKSPQTMTLTDPQNLITTTTTKLGLDITTQSGPTSSKKPQITKFNFKTKYTTPFTTSKKASSFYPRFKKPTPFSSTMKATTETTESTLKIPESTIKTTESTSKITESTIKTTQSTSKITESTIKTTESTTKSTEPTSIDIQPLSMEATSPLTTLPMKFEDTSITSSTITTNTAISDEPTNITITLTTNKDGNFVTTESMTTITEAPINNDAETEIPLPEQQMKETTSMPKETVRMEISDTATANTLTDLIESSTKPYQTTLKSTTVLPQISTTPLTTPTNDFLTETEPYTGPLYIGTVRNDYDLDDIFGSTKSTTKPTTTTAAKPTESDISHQLFDNGNLKNSKIIFSNFYEASTTSETSKTSIENSTKDYTFSTSQSYETSVSYEVNKKNDTKSVLSKRSKPKDVDYKHNHSKLLHYRPKITTDAPTKAMVKQMHSNNTDYVIYKAVYPNDPDESQQTQTESTEGSQIKSTKEIFDDVALSLVNHAKSIEYLSKAANKTVKVKYRRRKTYVPRTRGTRNPLRERTRKTT